VNIGIGMTDASSKLQIIGNPSEIGLKYSGDDGKDYIDAGTWGSGASRRGYFRIKDYSGVNRIVLTAANGNSWIYTSGNFEIGTDSPNSKLAVNGTITSKEVKVTLDGWSDFVFNKDYELKDLSEVESFIEEKNHLPDIPSEKEVLENGIQVGEMNAKLLQKIEELTLYLIEQNKEIKVLKEKIEKLETAE